MGLQYVIRCLHSQSMSQLPQNLLIALLLNFSSRLPWGWTRVETEIFEKNHVFWFFVIFFQLVINIIPYGSQNCRMLLLPQIAFESFQTFFWIFFSVVLTKVLFWIIEILSFWFFTIFFFIFINIGPYGSQNFKNATPPSNHFWSFQTFSELSSEWSSQKYCFGFLKF